MADIQSLNWLDIGRFYPKLLATNQDSYFAQFSEPNSVNEYLCQLEIDSIYTNYTQN